MSRAEAPSIFEHILPRAMRSDIRRARATCRMPLLAIMAAVLVASSSAAAQNPPLPATPPVDTITRDVGTVRPGDLLKLEVFKQPELTKTVLIDPFGNVDIAGVGSFRVAGLTPSQLK